MPAFPARSHYVSQRMALVLSVARIARKMRRSSSEQDSAVPGNCAQGAREEVAPREDHDHPRGGEHEQQRMEKPGQSRNRVVERENPAVVMLAGDADELRRTLGVRVQSSASRGAAPIMIEP
jgi:hypothetical protein